MVVRFWYLCGLVFGFFLVGVEKFSRVSLEVVFSFVF